MKALTKVDGAGARALEFLILTAARTGEVIGATWKEIDVAQRIWVIPADRMKAKREHRVPLTDVAIQLLGDEHSSQHPDEHRPLFCTPRGDDALSNMAMLTVLKRMKRTDITPHGFRSTFRDWVAEATEHQHELAEMALAHTINNKVEAAYRRGDMFERRRELMMDWAAFCRS